MTRFGRRWAPAIVHVGDQARDPLVHVRDQARDPLVHVLVHGGQALVRVRDQAQDPAVGSAVSDRRWP